MDHGADDSVGLYNAAFSAFFPHKYAPFQPVTGLKEVFPKSPDPMSKEVSVLKDMMEFLSKFSHLLPYLLHILLAVVFFLGCFFLRKPITRLVLRLLERCLKRFPLAKEILNGFEKPTCSLLTCIGIYLAVWQLTKGFPFLGVIMPVMLIFLRISIIVAVVRGFIKAAPPIVTAIRGSNTALDQTLVAFIARIVQVLLLILAGILIINETGYDISGMITGLGLTGLTFSLAAKDSASNLFGGLVIIGDKPFSVGDWIQTPEMEGTVTDITLRSTRIRTFKDAEVVIPNSTLANTSIINWSRMSKRRVHFTLGVVYGTPQDKLHAAVDGIRELLCSHPDDIEQSSILVTFNEFGAYSLNLEIYYYALRTTWADYMSLKEKVNFEIRDFLGKIGVEIAFPTQVLLHGETETE